MCGLRLINHVSLSVGYENVNAIQTRVKHNKQIHSIKS